jgi:hypothetical protein
MIENSGAWKGQRGKIKRTWKKWQLFLPGSFVDVRVSWQADKDTAG